MVRVAKKKGKDPKNKTANYQPVNSDSENDHYNEQFDPNDPFGDDEVEQFHNDKDKIMLDSLNEKKKKPFHYSSDEEEVLAFDDDDEDDDEEFDEKKFSIEDDEDEENEGDELADANDEADEEEKLIDGSWGRKKSSYYSGNRIQNDEDAQLEEEEARLLQKKMMKELDTNDFGLDAFQINKSMKILKTSDELAADKLAQTTLGDEPSTLDDETIEKVIKNLSKMSKKEKLDFLRQESPELFELVRDFKQKIDELESTLMPLYKLIKSGQIQHSLASDFIINKTKMYLMYCGHLSFYFILKSKRVTVENHPIVKNILQYRNLCKQIGVIDDQLRPEIDYIKRCIEANKQLSFRKTSDLQANKVKKSVKFRDSMARRDRLNFDDDEDEEEDEKGQSGQMENSEEAGVGKRAINYQIEKNKGLTPNRPKSYRNPRVRNRLKARKAHIKHKSIVPKVRSQEKRYSGEATGIRAGIVRAVKIK